MKNKKTFIVVALVIAVLLIGIGYAVISDLTLTISGTASAQANPDNFDVKFTGEPTKGGQGTTTATIDKATDPKGRTATINVTGLTAKGDTATATYTVTNASKDLTADLSVEVTTNSNSTYFKVTPELAQESITAGTETTVTVTVELLKTPVTADESANITVTLTASPVQPTV